MYLAAMVFALLNPSLVGELSYGTANWKSQIFFHQSTPTPCESSARPDKNGMIQTATCLNADVPILEKNRCCLSWQTKKWTDTGLNIENFFPLPDGQTDDLMRDKLPGEIAEKIESALVQTPLRRGFTLGEMYSNYGFNAQTIFGKHSQTSINYYAAAQLVRGGYDRGVSMLHSHHYNKVPDIHIGVGGLPVCQTPKLRWAENGRAINANPRPGLHKNATSYTLDYGEKNWDIEYDLKLTHVPDTYGPAVTFGFNLVKAKGGEGVVDLIWDNRGRLLLLGWARLNGKRKIVLTRWKATVTRDDVSISKDTSFGDGGIQIHELDADTVPVGLGVDSVGRILVGGKIKLAGRKKHDRLFVTRFKATGKPDTRFGFAGLAVVNSPGDRASSATGFAVDATDRAIVVGNNATGPMIARFTNRGKLDKSFGGKGWKSLTSSFRAEELILDGRGRMVLAGYKKSGAKAVQGQVWRYLNNGGLDQRFGQGGKVKFSGAQKSVQSIALGSRGRLIVAGPGFSASIRNGVIEDLKKLTGSKGAQVRVMGDQVIRLSW